jgi:hypothetical protein
MIIPLQNWGPKLAIIMLVHRNVGPNIKSLIFEPDTDLAFYCIVAEYVKGNHESKRISKSAF